MGYYNLADSLVCMRQWPDCLEVVDAALSEASVRHPLEVQMLYYKGISLAGLGRVEEGTQALERVLEAQPDHFYANKLLGACLLDLSQKDKARFYLQRAVELNVNDPDLPALMAQTGP
jgi:Flp pilus assembly protein TadD